MWIDCWSQHRNHRPQSSNYWSWLVSPPRQSAESPVLSAGKQSPCRPPRWTEACGRQPDSWHSPDSHHPAAMCNRRWHSRCAANACPESSPWWWAGKRVWTGISSRRLKAVAVVRRVQRTDERTPQRAVGKKCSRRYANRKSQRRYEIQLHK